MNLKGKVALITGSGRGITLACARAGAKVVNARQHVAFHNAPCLLSGQCMQDGPQGFAHVAKQGLMSPQISLGFWTPACIMRGGVIQPSLGPSGSRHDLPPL